jgi:HK97 family phage prohead protease
MDADAKMARREGRVMTANRAYWTRDQIAAMARRFGPDYPRIAAHAVLPLPRAVAPVAVTRADGDSKSWTFTISTASVDRYGDTIAIGGWKLDSYRKNPVVLWAHASALLPVGRATRTWTEGGRLRSTVQLASAYSADAAQVEMMIESGFLRAASVGFRPIRYAFADDASRKMGIDFLETELLEWSVVSVPANADCTIDSESTKSLSSAAARKRARDLDLVMMRLRA